jgi:hypothetical protein
VSSWTVVGFLVVVTGFALVERDTIRAEICRLRRRTRGAEAATAAPPCDD